MKKKISIITPAYNCASVIYKTYESIRSQSYDNWEWVITEDCSTDDTLSVIEEISKSDDRVVLLRNSTNAGAAVSRNNSISHSTGDFIAFIDSDDLWNSNKLLTQVDFMESKNIDFSFTAYEIIDNDGVSSGKIVDSKHTEPLTYKNMLMKKATLGCSTVMLRKKAFSDLKMPLIRTGQDYGLWLKLLKQGHLAYPMSNVLTQYRIVPNSISRNKFKKAQRQWQIYRDIERLNIIYSTWCFCFYAWRAVFRK